MIVNKGNRKPIDEGGSTLPSNLSLHELGQAMSQLDLSDVPPSRRRFATRAHLLRIMASSVQDTSLGHEIASSYISHLTSRAFE